jgi:hypothetical protein
METLGTACAILIVGAGLVLCVRGIFSEAVDEATREFDDEIRLYHLRKQINSIFDPTERVE